MNPQPSAAFVSIFTFAIIVLFIYHFVKAFIYGPHIHLPNDFITIGYLQSEPINIVAQQSKKIDGQFYLDCIDALHSLGFKKTQAKKMTKEIFEHSNPSTVQEFLSIALKK